MAGGGVATVSAWRMDREDARCADLTCPRGECSACAMTVEERWTLAIRVMIVWPSEAFTSATCERTNANTVFACANWRACS